MDDAITRSVTLDTDAEAAWALVTRAEDLESWLGAEVVLDPTPGAPGSVIDHDGTRRRLVIDDVDEGRRITWRWWEDGGDTAGAPSQVEITLTPSAGGTLVTVVEQPVPAAPGARAMARAFATAGAAAQAWSGRLLQLESLLLLATVPG
jgi:uncharacterized protein YndB with AHSA1/START domain